MNANLLLEMANGLFEAQPTTLSLLANASAFIYEHIEDLNWAGFYLNQNETLYLGPFQGRVACTIIPFHNGICGEAATKKETIVVADVSKHENHIACDHRSKSEIVIPIIINNNLYGVLDIDSPIINRFDHQLKVFFESFVKQLTKYIKND